MKEKEGVVKFMGHRLRIIKEEKSKFGERRYTLDCRPGCCTIPNGIRINCSEDDLRLIKEVWK